PPPAPPGLGAHPGFTPPVPARGRTTLAVSIVAAVVLLLCCGGGTALVGFGYYAYSTAQNDAIAAVERHLETLKAGNFTAAYEQLCPTLQQSQSREQYVQRREAEPRISTYRVFQETEAGPEGGLMVQAQVVRVDGGQRRLVYEVVYDDEGRPSICS
ncbi:MAG TPA: hypothetical protein VGR21_05015, partial [Cryptosporangiaceae bacterium]|nr:hypothetical protein [Cryptosporangiaceae bacterium]